MPLVYKKGNLLHAPERVIAHGVNCMGIMGAGVAKQIREKYPEVYTFYHRTCVERESQKNLLGQAQAIETYDGKFVFNLFTQYYLGEKGRHVNYEAVYVAFDKLFSGALELECSQIAIPRIGAGLAGGDWSIIATMILVLLKKYKDITVTVYDLT